MSVRLAVFDCDGTLVDGQAGVVSAMAAAFAECGLPAPDSHAVRRSVGLSLPQAMAALAPGADPATRAALDAAYRAAFRAARESGALAEPLYPGIRALLDGLRADGWELGIATGKSDRGLDHCLASHGLAGHFATLQTADRHPSKPHPAMILAAMAAVGAAPQQTVMIGDTVFDIAAGIAAGARPLGVDWGYHTAAELRDAGATAVATTAASLAELLR